MSLSSYSLHDDLSRAAVERYLSEMVVSVDRFIDNVFWLQNEARNAGARLLSLHTLINGKASINRLPGEVLLKIFFHVVHPLTRWYHVSHVCHRWRQLALQSHALWRDIVTPNVAFASVCMERSGGMPLRIKLRSNLGRTTISRLINCVRDSYTRIETVDFSTYTIQYPVTDFVKELTFPLDHLTTLRISQAPGMHNAATLVPNLNDKKNPWGLRWLQLGSVQLRWDWASSAFNSLHTLCLSDLSRSQAPTLEEFLQLLQHSRDTLADILLVRIDFPEVGFLTRLPSVTLPHLKTFHVEETWVRDHHMNRTLAPLSEVTIPETAQLYICNISHYDAVIVPLAKYLPAGLSHLGPLQAITSVHVTRRHSNHFQVRGYTDGLECDVHPPTFEYKLRGSERTVGIQVIHLFEDDNLAVLKLSPLRALSLTCDIAGISLHNWTALRQFSELESLHLSHRPLNQGASIVQDAVMRIKMLFTALSPSAKKPQPILPQLGELHLHGFEGKSGETEQLLAAARLCLKSRREAKKYRYPVFSVWVDGSLCVGTTEP